MDSNVPLAAAVFLLQVFNCNMWSYLLYADRIRVKNWEQNAWHWRKWNCSARLVSASQTHEQSSMGFFLGTGAKDFSYFPISLLFSLVLCLISTLLYCTLLTPTPLTIFTFIVIFNFLSFMSPFPPVPALRVSRNIYLPILLCFCSGCLTFTSAFPTYV